MLGLRSDGNRGGSDIEMQEKMIVRKVTLIASLVAAGVLMGALAGQFTSRFNGTIAIPFDGNIQLFRKSEQLANTIGRQVEYLATLATPAEREVLQVFAAELRSGRSTVEHGFRTSRRDLLDAPEAVAKDARFAGTQSRIRITARGATADRARAVTLAGAEYIRDSLAAARIEEMRRSWNVDARTERDRIEVERVARRSTIESLNRKIAGLSSIAGAAKPTAEGGQTGGSDNGLTASGAPAGPVQVQVTGASAPRYLSPGRQVLGLRSLLVEELEAQKLAEERLEYLEVAEKFHAQTVGKGLSEMIELVAKLPTGTSSKTGLGALRARSEIVKNLNEIARAAREVPFEPREPVITPSGLRSPMLAMLGGLLGLMLGLGLVYGRRLQSIWAGRLD